MTVTAISAISSNESVSQTTTSSSTSSEVNGLGQEAFLTLLLAQLENQDPLNPMDDADFIAQLAQFNSLSELTKINDTLEQLTSSHQLAGGSALIGKVVTGLSSSGEQVTGLVQGVSLTDASVMLDVDGATVPLAMVTAVQAPEEEADTESEQV